MQSWRGADITIQRKLKKGCIGSLIASAGPFYRRTTFFKSTCFLTLLAVLLTVCTKVISSCPRLIKLCSAPPINDKLSQLSFYASGLIWFSVKVSEHLVVIFMRRNLGPVSASLPCKLSFLPGNQGHHVHSLPSPGAYFLGLSEYHIEVFNTARWIPSVVHTERTNYLLWLSRRLYFNLLWRTINTLDWPASLHHECVSR